MKFWDLVKIANRNLLRSKLRTFLTIMAIFVGSFTLILTNGIGDGLRDYIDKQVKNTEGEKILFVSKKFESQRGKESINGVMEYKEKPQTENNEFSKDSRTATLPQIENAFKDLPEVKTITPRYYIGGEYLTVDGSKKYRLMLGMISEGITKKTEVGHTIDGANQILIPLPLAKALNEDISQVIGKTAIIAYKIPKTDEIRTLSLQIVGVMTKGFLYEFSSYVDSQTARKIYDDQQKIEKDYNQFGDFTVQLKADNNRSIAEIKKKIDEKGFTAETFADKDKRAYDGIGIIQIGLNFFAFIALFAASFGIINTLVIAVMERTKEIGLQKALGMGRGKVFLLFSLESILIGFWGAVAGIVGGIVIGTITNIILEKTYFESFEGYNLFSFKPFSIIFVILLVCIIAFLAGVLPAFRASRLNPIEALRYE